MKKFSSVFTFLTVVALVCPMTSCVVGKTSGEELSVLTQEAYGLGADTDYLGIASFKYDYSRPVPYQVYKDFLERFDMASTYFYQDFVTAVIDKSGYNTGTSILNILAHNGVIKPSDIDENAVTMADVSYSENVGRLITGYESITAMTDFANYRQYLKDNFTFEEQVDRLLAMAEKAESENRYFLVSYNYTYVSANGNILKSSNDVTGLGIADGNWNFNNSSYDKCIITLDPNSKTSDGLAGGFDEQYCIYINSETKECYIPAYKAGGKLKSEIVFASMDDDTFFNYKGLINPSDTIETDIPNFVSITKRVTPHNNQFYYITSDGELIPLKQLTDDDVKYSFFDNMLVTDCTAMRFVANGGSRTHYRYSYPDRYMIADIDNLYSFTDITMSDKKLSVKNISYDAPEGFGHEPQEYSFEIIMTKGTHDFAPYTNICISGQTDSEVSYEFTDDGIILRSPEKLHTSVGLDYSIYDENGDYQETVQTDSSLINSVSDVFLKFDENNQIQVLFDDDGDGVFDAEMKKGDVNMDGMIDAADASEILAHYSFESTAMGSTNEYTMNTINTKLGDVNGDGTVNAADASVVLSMYAESSTSN